MFGKKTETYGAGGMLGRKIFLLVCAAVAAVIDVVIIAMLFVGGEGGEYLAAPFILLILDAAYLIMSLFFTDFRFKYSVAVWVCYVILYTVGFSIGNSIILGGDGTVVTQSALILWECVHAFNIVSAIVCALFASRVIRNAWFALAFAALFAIGGIVYAGLTFADGFFGQGTGYRTLVYTLHESDYYSVSGVLGGRSNRVVVPEEFNGKPVRAVSLKVFTAGGINDYELPANVSIVADDSINGNLNLSGKRIKVDKKSVNGIRNDFLHFAAQSDNARANAVALANATLPANLAANEGYVAFNYSAESYERAHGNVVPVYVGDLTNFNLDTYTQDFLYVANRDNGTAENYYAAYQNGGYILSAITDGFDKNTVIDMEFEKVYRIKVDDGNDTKYRLSEKQPELCFDTVGGSDEYKYVTEKTAESFFDGLTPRAGFTYDWRCGGNVVTNLKDLLINNLLENEITLSVNWRLEKPAVTVGTSAPSDTITYGENVNLTYDVSHPADGIRVICTWEFDNTVMAGWGDNVELVNPKPSENAGMYTLNVLVGGGETTSLTVETEATVNLKINRKQVALNWHLPEDLVYDGTAKSVSVSVNAGDEVAGDPVDYTLMGTASIIDAKDYNSYISLDIEDEKNYNVTNPAVLFSVTPRPVDVVWSNDTLTYNGSEQAPAATANGVAADGPLSVTVSGGRKNAGEGYTARASITNENYTLNNPDHTYKITKKPLTATLGDATVVYGDNIGTVGVTYNGFVGGDGAGVMSIPIFYNVPAVGDGDYNVGTFTGGVRCTGLNADNYSVTVVNGNLTVTPRTVNIAWNTPANFTYDGTAKNVTATVGNKLAGDDVTLTVSGGNGVTVDTYTATVTGVSGADAGNYKLPDSVTLQYRITKRTASVVWNAPNPAYDGEEHEVTYTVNNLAAGDDVHFTQIFKYKNAGDYTFEVVKDEYIQTNYTLNNSSFKFTVAKAQAKITLKYYSEIITTDEFRLLEGENITIERNIPGVFVKGTYRREGNETVMNFDDLIQFSYVGGVYYLTFCIEETSNYYGDDVTLTLKDRNYVPPEVTE